MQERYEADETVDAVAVLEHIAEVRSCKKQGNELDIDKAAGILMEDFRSGRLGKITLETP